MIVTVALKEHVERHRLPNILINLLYKGATILAVHLCQELCKHARLLQLESAA